MGHGRRHGDRASGGGVVHELDRDTAAAARTVGRPRLVERSSTLRKPARLEDRTLSGVAACLAAVKMKIGCDLVDAASARGMKRCPKRLLLAGAMRRWALAAALAACAPATGAAITLQDPAHFQVARTFAVSPAIPRPVGGLRFSADGTTLYVVGAADTSASALYRVAVTLNASQQVTALGAPVKVFNGVNPNPGETEAGLDAGLEFGPAGTFFYTYFPTNFIGERPGGRRHRARGRSDERRGVGLTFAPRGRIPARASDACR